jgi:hypothetical protein
MKSKTHQVYLLCPVKKMQHIHTQIPQSKACNIQPNTMMHEMIHVGKPTQALQPFLCHYLVERTKSWTVISLDYKK